MGIVELRTLGNFPEEYDLDAMVMSDRVSLLRRLLDAHDLTYQFSDDHRVWSRGESHMEAIRLVARTIPTLVYNDEWNRMVRKNFSADYLMTEEGKGWLRR